MAQTIRPGRGGAVTIAAGGREPENTIRFEVHDYAKKPDGTFDYGVCFLSVAEARRVAGALLRAAELAKASPPNGRIET